MFYRIYLTDATPDNIVVDSTTLRISFVDLDGIIVVDSIKNPFSNVTETVAAAEWNKIDRYEIIECLQCFAYEPETLHKHHISDINVFAICQVINSNNK